MTDLPGRIRARARLAGVTHDDLVYFVSRNAGTFEGCPRGHCPELRWMYILQRPAVPPDRGPCRSKNDNLARSHNY
jgi:hypothetical protein